MIKKFEDYELNEGWKNDVSSLALMVFLIFNKIGGDVPRRYDMNFLEKYVKTMNIANKDQLVQKVIRDFKAKISNDPKILNKQEVYNVIDNTPIVFRNNDEIMYILYKHAKGEGKSEPSSWCSTYYTDENKKDGKSIIFLARNAPYSEILHELSHATETVIKIDPKITELFNFRYNEKQQKFMFSMINNDPEMPNRNYMTRGVYQEHIEYLNNPSEIYSRLNNLKMFLFNNKILKTPNEEISESLLADIITGRLYAKLGSKARKEFKSSDFMEILIFLDIKKSWKINRYVEDRMKQKTNLA